MDGEMATAEWVHLAKLNYIEQTDCCQFTKWLPPEVGRDRSAGATTCARYFRKQAPVSGSCD